MKNIIQQKEKIAFKKLFPGVFVLAIALLLPFGNVQALDDETLEEIRLGKEIVQMIEYPEVMMAENKTDNGIVVLYFYLTPSGTINVINTEGDDVWLNKYVENALHGKHLDNYLDYEPRKYQVPIQFKTTRETSKLKTNN